MYYLRTKPAANAVQFTVDKTKLGKTAKTKEEKAAAEEAMLQCSINNKEACLMCSA